MKEIARSAAVIAAEINAIKSQTSGILEAAFTYAKRSSFEIGKRLEEAKATVPYGEWGTWLEENVSYSVSTANDLMRIYREFGNEQIDMLTGKSDAEVFEGLSQSQMVALFGLPKPLRAEFVEEHRDELESGEMSSRKLKEEIKRLNAVIKQKDNEKPIETVHTVEKVYEASPEQIEAIRAAAVKETEDKLGKIEKEFQAKYDKLEKKYNDKKAELDAKESETANKIRAAVDAAVAESDKKVRQLTAQSDPRTAKVSYCLEAIGRAMADINGIVAAMNTEAAGSGDQIRAKCEAALLRLTSTYGWQI